MRTRGLGMLGLLLAVGLCPVAHGQGEFALTRVPFSGEPPPVAAFASRYAHGQAERPPSVTASPKVSAQAMYYVATFGETQVAMLCDLQPEPRLFVDRNLDGDLSDEIPLAVRAARAGDRATSDQPAFEPVTLTMPGGGTVDLQMHVYHQSAGFGYMEVTPASYRAAEVELAGVQYSVHVVDATLDGRYDNRFGAPGLQGTDWMAIDLNRDGRMQASRSGPSEVFPLPHMVRVGEAHYEFEFAPDGSSVRIAEAAPEIGTLAIDGDNAQLTLWSDSGVHVVTSAESPVSLPSGNYRTVEVLLSRQKGNETWTLSAPGDAGGLADIRIAAGKTTTVEAGEPLQCHIEPTGAGGQVYFGFSLSGRAGETYSAGADRNGRRQGAPGFEILNEAGDKLAAGTFEYG